MDNLLEQRPQGQWVQTERSAHEAWAHFLSLRGAKAASQVMHLLLSRMGKHNAVAISVGTIAELLDCNERTVRRATAMLHKHNWIEIGQIGGRGTTNVYIINDRIAWNGRRNGIRYSLFSANVIISENEQPDRLSLSEQAQLKKVPEMFPGEEQLPTGEGLPPPSEPTLPGMEPDLPAVTKTQADEEE